MIEILFVVDMASKIIASESYGSSKEKNICAVSVGGLLTSHKTNLDEKSAFTTSCKKIFKSAFLPQGYPESVSSDYLEYQIWDTMQAFCSSITGMLATQAMLKGYGVGDERATIAAATITWMLKDGAGMVGRIIFAWMKGTQLDCDAKRWRLHADILNDLAILLDLIAPVFKVFFVYIACLSSIARSIVAVAGGATRAALTLHQAKRDNMADVSAKDGSQETLVNLMALIAGFIITPFVADKQLLIWILFFVFTSLHLFANYKAVSAVVMETVNLPRMYILMNHYFKHAEILTPTNVSILDPVLKGPGYHSRMSIGVPLKHALYSAEDLQHIISFYHKLPMYIIGVNQSKSSINIVIHKGTSSYDIRKSCFHALLLDMVLSNKFQVSNIIKRFNLKLVIQDSFDDTLQLIKCTQEIVEEIYSNFDKELDACNWDLNRCHLGVDEWRFEWDNKLM